MKTTLVTGAEGFIGRNLCLALRRTKEFEVLGFDVQQSLADLPDLASRADVVFHLAGVNRPKDEREFMEGNADLTRVLCDALAKSPRRPVLVVSSSIQAELDNPYGRSKKAGEAVVVEWQKQTGHAAYVFRFPNVFGKWSRPNYNTVVATFCHNVSRGLPVQISNRANVIRFAYVDDIVRTFLDIARRETHDPTQVYRPFAPEFSITLGELHDRIVSFQEHRQRGVVPDLADPFTRYLHATFTSFLDPQNLSTPVDLKTDNRGWLFELMKSPHAGQVFVSKTKPGITRGNHYHDTKIEKFCVIEGEGIIRFRHILDGTTAEYRVNGDDIRVVDIPPGYTHSIENTGSTDMITLFWANEIFDPQRADTHPEPVLR